MVNVEVPYHIGFKIKEITKDGKSLPLDNVTMQLEMKTYVEINAKEYVVLNTARYLFFDDVAPIQFLLNYMGKTEIDIPDLENVS